MVSLLLYKKNKMLTLLIYNVEVASLQIDASLDAESNAKLEAVEDLETDIIEAMADELVIENAGYKLSDW